MGAHNHDSHVSEHKPVSFTVPFILGMVTVIIILLFVSFCDPKQHHASGEHQEHASEQVTTEHSEAH
ncbi:MAG: hypothetical protein JSU07_05855 [Bacteroidetes bacterium]|nr:hypothetical protein [Bacteroidota bacterium]